MFLCVPFSTHLFNTGIKCKCSPWDNATISNMLLHFCIMPALTQHTNTHGPGVLVPTAFRSVEKQSEGKYLDTLLCYFLDVDEICGHTRSTVPLAQVCFLLSIFPGCNDRNCMLFNALECYIIIQTCICQRPPKSRIIPLLYSHF